jgi:hypothetical protein
MWRMTMGQPNCIAGYSNELQRMEALLAEYEAALQAPFNHREVEAVLKPATVTDVKATIARLRQLIAELTKASD